MEDLQEEPVEETVMETTLPHIIAHPVTTAYTVKIKSLVPRWRGDKQVSGVTRQGANTTLQDITLVNKTGLCTTSGVASVKWVMWVKVHKNYELAIFLIERKSVRAKRGWASTSRSTMVRVWT